MLIEARLPLPLVPQFHLGTSLVGRNFIASVINLRSPKAIKLPGGEHSQMKFGNEESEVLFFKRYQRVAGHLRRLRDLE